ncbi:uncharacterized protein [Lepeophtheirus salmonis]|nr:uncharacterized protein LOC121115933 [Lepeophtheirus salmonis]
MGGHQTKPSPKERTTDDENKDPYTPVSTESRSNTSASPSGLEEMDETPVRNPRFKALSSDPRSPSGLPRTPILVEEDANKKNMTPRIPTHRMLKMTRSAVEASCRSPLLIENDEALEHQPNHLLLNKVPKNLNESLDEGESLVI